MTDKVLKILFFSCFFWLISGAMLIQAQPPVKEFHRNEIYVQRQEMADAWLNGKELPSSMKLPGLVALSYFPDLKEVDIEFRRRNIKTTMVCRPRMDFIFRKKENRTYRIIANNQLRGKQGLLFDDVPFNAQIGIMAHELAHVVDYENKTAAGIIVTGIRYLFPGYRRKLEQQIDELAIERGMGYQIHAFSDFVIHHAAVTDQYRDYKKRFYFSPDELLEVMLEIPDYLPDPDDLL